MLDAPFLRVLAAVLPLLVLGSGCATVIKGRYADVQILSEPAGAEIIVDGEPVGRSPVTATLHQGRHAVEARLDGYKTAQDDIRASFSGHSLWFGTLSVLTDAAFQTILTIDDEVLTLRLEPSASVATGVAASPQPAPPAGGAGAPAPGLQPPAPDLGTASTGTSKTTLGKDGLQSTTTEESADRKASSSLELGPQGTGLGVAYSEQSLERRDGPVDAVRVTTWSVAYTGVFGGMGGSNGGGGGIGIRYLDPSGNFPAEGGGSVHALDARAAANLFMNSAGDATFAMGQLLGSLGYTYLNIYPQKLEDVALPPEERKSSGIGFNVGLGVTASIPFAENAEPAFGPAPMIGLEFPTYNPGTARYSSFNILGFVLPPGILGDMTLVSISLAGTFDT